MKKVLAAVCLAVFMFGAAHAEEIYDPQHTMLALNMAIVSVHRILATQDRIILEQEYQNIINNLSLGNIESDKDMTALYSDLTGIISRKRLRSDEAEFLRSRYDQREQNLTNKALSGIQAQGENAKSIIGNLAVSCVSSYFEYQAMRSELAEELRGEAWQLTKEDIADCNNLQERLLNSSWNLLRKYGLPDSYRLVQRTLDDFYKAVNEKDPAKRFRMLRELERDFHFYPPYWVYIGKTAQELGSNSQAHLCFERFNKVWRPVLRQDPYKVEVLKFELSEIVSSKNLWEKEKHRVFDILNDITENTPRDDWANKLFAGIAYFLLGNKSRGIEIVEANVDFGYGADVSMLVLNQLKRGSLNPKTLHSSIVEQVTLKRIKAQMKDEQLMEALIAYFEGKEDEAEKALESMSVTSENPVVFRVLHLMNALKNYPKAAMFDEKRYSLYNKDNEAYNQAFAEVKPLLEFYAGKQVPSAQTFLGEMYDFGLGVNMDEPEAMKWYLKAADQGYAYAQIKLGDMYYFTYGVNQDYVEAVKWWRKAAEQGYAEAQYKLGDMYNFGMGVNTDEPEAMRWYLKAADQGHAEAQEKLGIMYENGYGVKKNYPEAVKWYRKAAEQENAYAQYRLGEMYYWGNGVEKDYTETLKWALKAAKQGITGAQFRLGYMYYVGNGVRQDYAEAVKWFHKAAEKGHADAQSNLGIMYYWGCGVTKDYAEAVKWWRKAADQGIAGAQHNLGIMYYIGYGVEKDYAEAVKWYRKAAEQGDAPAQNNLGKMYKNGYGVSQDDAEAVKWWRKAADQGHADSQNNLGMMYKNGYGVEKDYAEAVKWWLKAAEQAIPEAQFNLGWMYQNGYGVKKDYKAAYMWYFLAHLSGYSSANDNARELEKGKYPKVSSSEVREAQLEALRKYDEIKKRQGSD